MANGKEIQVDNGEYTRIHNAILEALAKVRLSGAEFRCVMFLIRKTYGWQKKEDKISLSQWADGMDAKRPHVLATLNNLIKKKVIYRRLDDGQVPFYGFNKYVELWENVEVNSERGRRFTKYKELLPKQVTVTKAGNSTVTKAGTHKRNIKENIKENMGDENISKQQIDEMITSFSDAANILPISEDYGKWTKEVKVQIKRGLTPEDIRAAVRQMRSSKDNLTIGWPGSVTKVAIDIHSKGANFDPELAKAQYELYGES